MIKLIPILLPFIYGFVMYRLSAWRLGRELDAKSTPLRDPGLDRVLVDMACALDLQRINVNIYEIAPINGLAAPDGRIFITRGFMEKYQHGLISAEELASVIAHELGHVALGHSRRRMIDFSGQNALRSVLSLMISRFIPWVGGWIANFLITLISAKLSRKDEYEADAYAAALLTKAGIGIDAQISMFEKLRKMSGALHGASPAWLLSHPAPNERIEALRKLQQHWEQ